MDRETGVIQIKGLKSLLIRRALDCYRGIQVDSGNATLKEQDSRNDKRTRLGRQVQP
jgi:hypothetical protein